MKLAHRIMYYDHMGEDAFDKLYSYTQRNIDCVDEIALLTEFSHHGYVPLEHMRKNAVILKEHIKKLKELGVKRVGINILCTIGHIDEAWEWVEPSPYQTVIGHDGTTSTSNLCMRGDGYREYILEKYRIYAGAEPDFIWLDDDMRINNHTAQYPCFCEKCISEFNKLYSSSWERGTLVEALNSPSGDIWRRRWVEYNRDALRTLLKDIGDTVRAVDRNIRLGLMACSPEYACYGGSDIKEMLKALKADMLRPGGGFYADERLDEAVLKSYNAARQCAMSEHDSDIQYELEDFPYQNEKSLHMHVVEITAALMAGCDGIALNMDSSKDRTGLADKLREYRPLWEHITASCSGRALKGAYAAYNKEFVYSHKPDGNWFRGYAGDLVNNEQALGFCGLPLTMLAEESSLTILSGEMARPYSDEELKEMLKGGLLIDAEALRVFEERGLSELCGCVTDKAYFSGIQEIYNDDAMNGELKGWTRNTFMNFGNRRPTVYSLKKLSGNVRELSRLQSVTGIECGSGMLLYENTLGGRVAVMPYETWRYPDIRRRFIRRLCDWLSRGNMPLFINEDVRVISYIRQDNASGAFTAMLLNTSMDATGEFSVTLNKELSKAENIAYVNNDGTMTDLKDITSSGEGRADIKIKNLAPWEFVIIEGR